MEIDYKIIGQRIKEVRKMRGWSQERLSEEIDVTTVYISRIERGTSNINLKRLAQISKALNTTIEYLIGGTMTESPNYLDKELYETLLNCTPAKQRLIYNIAQIVSNAKFV
jgi:transcriptional regulator with XRE-family HTH domain